MFIDKEYYRIERLCLDFPKFQSPLLFYFSSLLETLNIHTTILGRRLTGGHLTPFQVWDRTGWDEMGLGYGCVLYHRTSYIVHESKLHKPIKAQHPVTITQWVVAFSPFPLDRFEKFTTRLCDCVISNSSVYIEMLRRFSSMYIVVCTLPVTHMIITKEKESIISDGTSN